MSKWFRWQPDDAQIKMGSQDNGSSKLPKRPLMPPDDSNGGFGSPQPGKNPIIQSPDQPESLDLIIEKSPAVEPTKPAKLPWQLSSCPYGLPTGVRLLGYTQKKPPVALTVCSVVNDVPKFVRHALAELDARLHHPIQIKAGDSVFDLLSKLGDCGLELALEWQPKLLGEVQAGLVATGTPQANVTLPEAAGVEITEEDIPL